MVKDDREDVRPLYRPKDWDTVNRRNKKRNKRNNWSGKGGHIAPIFVPPTPNGELAKSLREITERETELGVKFLIVETGGGCDDLDCLPCKSGKGDGGNCRSCGPTTK